MSYKVYLVSSAGLPRDHHALFVETDRNGTGSIYQVTGNIQEGMAYEYKPGQKPDASVEFIGKDNVGTVSTQALSKFASICEGVPPPRKQFDGSRRLFPGEKLRRCQEWTREAVLALREAGVLRNQTPGSE